MTKRSLCVALLALSFVACNGGGGGRSSARFSAKEDPLASGAATPAIQLEGGAATALFWKDTNGRVISAQIVSQRDGTNVRVTIDPASGEPTRIDNLVDNSFTLIQDGAGRVDFLQYDANGAFLSGFSVATTSTGFSSASLLGAAAFTGQIKGQLTLPGQTGSFAVVTKSSGDLGPATPLTVAQVQLLNALAAATVAPGTLAAVTLSKAMKFGGLLVGGAALGGALAPAYGAAGVAMILSGVGADTISDYLRNRFTTSDPLAQELVDLAANNIADPGSPRLGDFWTDLTANFADGQRFSSSVLEQLKNALSPQPGDPGNAGQFTLPSAVQAPTTNPPPIEVDVEGQAVWQDGAIYPISGSVDATGRVDAAGQLQGGPATDTTSFVGQINGTDVTGTCDRNGVAGTLTGTTEPLGECNTSTASGGQGTFTFAQFIGPGQGNITFTYEAFNIPDQFVLSTANGVRFSTNGLVSGGQTVTIAIDNEPIVFISVSAPNSGTAWEYEISCLN